MRSALRAAVLAAAALALAAPTFTNPVIRGDYPDPTVLRAGDAFYASATSGSWAPLFPLFRSTDLVTWRQVGALLPRAPAWAAGRFWAPELSFQRRRYVAYFSASRRDGRPCIGVLTAPRPEGPWRDRGRAACPPEGAIDAAPVHDRDGSRWLLWKALGRGGGIYAQRLNAAGLRVTGPALLLIRPDETWEEGVTEGPAIVAGHGGLYLFYAGGHCCRPPCTYAEGVAWAPSLAGPWTKAPGNPFLRGDDAFRCPGHGTLVDLGAPGLFLLHHAYLGADVGQLRRQPVLTRIEFGPDGWPLVGGPQAQWPTPLGTAPQPTPDGFTDGFAGAALGAGWEWPFDRPPNARVASGDLTLRCAGPTALVAHQVPADRYAAVATLEVRGGRDAGRARAGVGVVAGDDVRGVELAGRTVRAFSASPAGVRPGPAVPIGRASRVRLFVSVSPGGGMTTWAAVGGAPFAPVPPGPAAIGPAPTRVALTCRGHGTARFASLRVRPLAAG
jgi:xylan 1,4-beta-xylosidase